MSDSLQPHGLQHARPPCPSPTPGACSNSCPSRWWCHPTISSSVVPSPLTFNLSQHRSLFQWVIRLPKYWSFSFSISPSNEYSGLISFRIDWSLRAEILRYRQGVDGNWGMEKEGLGALWLLFCQWSRKEGHWRRVGCDKIWWEWWRFIMATFGCGEVAD